MDVVLSHQDGVVGAPGFLSPFGNGESLRQVVQLLEGVFHLDAVAEMVGIDVLFKLLFEAVAYHKDHLAKAGTDGVVHRVVHDDFAVGAHAVHLFQSAVAAAHTGSKNK